MKNCGNCVHYKDDGPKHFKIGYGVCRRYPERTRTNDGKMCGEHALIEQENTNE